VALSVAEAGPADACVVSGLANVALQFGAALGVAVLFGAAADRSAGLLAGGSGLRSALDGGYHLAFAIAALCLVAAIGVALAVLRPPARALPAGADVQSGEAAGQPLAA
jgi:hypothetical protein